MLCSCCKGLTIERLLELHKLHLRDEYYIFKDFPDAFYEHQPSFQSLVESARYGCDICQAITDAFTADRECMAEVIQRTAKSLDTSVGIHIELNNKESETPDLQVFDRLLIKIGFEYEDSDDCLDDEVVDWSGDSQNGNESVDADGHLLTQSCEEVEDSSDRDLSDYPWPGRRTVLLSLTRPQFSSFKLDELRVGEPYRGYGLHSLELTNLSREWLRSCVSEHPDENCPPLQECPLPTRLIDIGSLDGVEGPKLFVSSGRRGLYVALSHCWGSEMPLKTTTESLEQYCLSLPTRLIPKTFQDAMTITRELGFRYLWIDSLCIVQDSRHDWEQQSAIMDDVYKNAVITIAAAASWDSKAGIFDVLEEKPKYYGALKLCPECLPSDCVQVSTFKGDETLMDPMFRLPLATRGWALQERILSQRVLHYGRRRVYWQCRASHISADGNPPDDHAVLDSATGALLKLPRSLKDADRPSQLKMTNDKWLRVVESYCRYRKLTFATDKLPSMAGTARTLQELTGDVYLAGIWEGDWARGVLWQTWDYTRRIQDRAPSWSWARWDGYIVFEMSHYRTIEDDLLAQLLQHHVQLAGENPFGEVTSGSLHLRAWATIRTLDKIDQLGELRLDDYSMNPYHKDMKEIVRSFAETEYMVILIGLFLGHTQHEVPLEIWKRGMLLLKPVDSESSTTFERIGAVFHRSDTHGEFDMTGWRRQELTVI